MRTIFISILAILASISLVAQNSINAVLTNIEKNNTTLKALREIGESQKLANKTGISLGNPEIEFNYLWGNPSDIGNRTDINVKQTFDIPTITGMKNKVANQQNNLVEWQYKTDRMNILLEAKLFCIELTYYNALKKELETRLQHAEAIAEGYKKGLESGDVSILEYNKVQLNLSTAQGEISRIDVERNALLSQLKRLNGGMDVVFEDYQFGDITLSTDFDEWFAQAAQKNPVLAYIEKEIEISKKQVSLSKAMGLPSFSAGYMSEKVVGQQFQGISVGISIPLWQNKNHVKQAKAAVVAAESRQTDSKQQFYSQLQILYDRTKGLKNIATSYHKSLSTVNNTNLLGKALEVGEISLLDYLVEIGFYYNTINQLLEAERDYQKAFAELSAVEL
jgi:outer membrane protein TolC